MARKKLNEDFSIFDEVLNNTPEEDKLFVTRSLEIADQIITLMEARGLLQKDLANLLEKKEPEISKWLCGFHNFTLKSIVKIEAKLGERIITTPKQAKEEMECYFRRYYRTKYNKWIRNVRHRLDMKRTSLPIRELGDKGKLQFHEKTKLAKIIGIKDYQKSYVSTQVYKSTGT
jgi:predicted XRE-type DNA-binding protein